MPMILLMATSLIKPTKFQLLIIFIASFTTAVSGSMIISAYVNLNSLNVDKSPVIYNFTYPDGYDRPNEFGDERTG